MKKILIPFFLPNEKKRHVVHNFFIYSESRKASQCKKENCQAWICGENTTNLTNHLKKLCYKIVYEKFLKKVEESNILKRYTKLKSVMCHTSDKTMAKKQKLGCCVPGCFPKKTYQDVFLISPKS